MRAFRPWIMGGSYLSTTRPPFQKRVVQVIRCSLGRRRCTAASPDARSRPSCATRARKRPCGTRNGTRFGRPEYERCRHSYWVHADHCWTALYYNFMLAEMKARLAHRISAPWKQGLTIQQQTSPGRHLRDPQAPQQQSSHGSLPVRSSPSSVGVRALPNRASMASRACFTHTASQSMCDASIFIGCPHV